MKRPTRIKPTPISSVDAFTLAIDELATLEAMRRKIEAERDLEVAAVKTRFAERLGPIEDRIKGKGALVLAYAEEHRAALLPKDKKSATTALAVYGWRTGNRCVKLLSRVSEELAINALKALGLGYLVRQVEAINRDQILSDCKDDKTIGLRVGMAHEMPIALSDAGLRIAQGETFYVEPRSDAATTLKPVEAAA
jgi:phage host-nuclease inhibitor protein Gam